MKKFKFKMQAVLRAREIREDERKRDLAIEIKIFDEETLTLNNLVKKKKQSIEALRKEKTAHHVDIKALYSFEHYLFLLELKMSEQDIKLTGQKLKVKQAQRNLTDAMKERKIMESLKEKAKVVYFNEIAHAEMKVIDEFNVLRKNYVKYS